MDVNSEREVCTELENIVEVVVLPQRACCVIASVARAFL